MNYPKKSQFNRQQDPNFLSSNLIIRMVQINVAVAKSEKFPMIEKAPALDIFFGIIYTTIPKLLTIMSTTV